MTEKNQQEKMAAERQVELFTHAFEKAKDNGGVWLDNKGRKAPGLYQKHLQVSPFNALILGMHADQHNYKTNQYTLFSDAKKRGESVQTKEKGVPFLWYSWNEYVSKSNPEDRISRADYQALTAEQQSDYKGIRTREVRALFNIEQTTLPMVDKTSYEKVVQDYGRLEDRVDVAAASEEIRHRVENLLANAGQYMVEIRSDSSGVAHYDSAKDVIFLPEVSSYENYEDYARDAVSLLVSATGHQQRLAREGMGVMNGKTSPEDAEKQERLIVEVATAVKLQELGISAKLSPESLKMTDYWSRELRENPCLVDIVERDVNNAVDMLHKAERGEKVELNSQAAQKQINAIRSILPKHFYVADEIKTLPNRDTKEFVIVKDPSSKMADVVLPEGASLGADNDIPGMNKGRIEHALQKEGYDTVTFYNADGSMGYRPDDSFFDGKAVSVARLNKWNLDTITLLDVSDAVKRSGAVDFERILMMRDDDGKWALYMKPENEKSFCVYPDKTDVNLFFTTVKQGNEEVTESMRQDMAQKYYLATTEKPEQRVDIFKSDATPEELNQIERVNIFKTKATETQPSVILCLPTVNGEKLKPREVTPSQWQRLWLADDMQDYKKHLAASLFADVLRKGRTDAVAVGTDKSEQEAQTEDVAQKPVQQEDKTEEDSKKEEKQIEEAKEETTKAETKAVAAASLSPMLKQFYDLKAKHPDAILLFRCGDFYETYCNDAEKASKILGITLTRSNRTKDIEGKPLSMAGFPYHALDTYLPKLIRAGERVAIYDQLGVPKKNQGPAENQVAESTRQEKKQKMTDEERYTLAEELKKNIGHRCQAVPFNTIEWVDGYIAGVIEEKRSNKVLYAIKTDDGRRIVKVHDSNLIRIFDEVVELEKKVRTRKAKDGGIEKVEWTPEAIADAINEVIGNVGKAIKFEKYRFNDPETGEEKIEYNEGRIVAITPDKHVQRLYYRISVPAPIEGNPLAVKIMHKVVTAEGLQIAEDFDEEGQKLNAKYCKRREAAAARISLTPQDRFVKCEEALKKAEEKLQRATEELEAKKQQLEDARKELDEWLAGQTGETPAQGPAAEVPTEEADPLA